MTHVSIVWGDIEPARPSQVSDACSPCFNISSLKSWLTTHRCDDSLILEVTVDAAKKKKCPLSDKKKCPLSDEISPFCYWFLLISTASSAYLYIYMHTILYIYIYVCSFWLIHFPYTNEPSERSDLLTIPQFRTIKRITTYIICLVVDLPLWKIWVRQLGWWNSQLNGKS